MKEQFVLLNYPAEAISKIALKWRQAVSKVGTLNYCRCLVNLYISNLEVKHWREMKQHPRKRGEIRRLTGDYHNSERFGGLFFVVDLFLLFGFWGVCLVGFGLVFYITTNTRSSQVHYLKVENELKFKNKTTTTILRNHSTSKVNKLI